MSNVLRGLSLNSTIAQEIADLVDARTARVMNGQRLVGPSGYWADFIKNFAYVFELSERSLDGIRYHTYHLTSDLYQRYYFGSKDDANRILSRYALLSAAIQSRALAEPPSGIGYRHEDGLVSWDALRYLSVIRDLLDAKLLDQHTPVNIVEIGAGYGGLCRMISTLNPQAQYTIVDLEETLFFSKCYLARTLPDYDVTLIRHASELRLEERRVNLIPQQFADELSGHFDLAINHQSMQEMQVAQIDRYLRFIAQNCQKFYSRNMARQDLDIALRKGLSLDTHSQVLGRLPQVLWAEGPSNDDVIDDNLLRFVVSSESLNAEDAVSVPSLTLATSPSARIDEHVFHEGVMLEAHELGIDSSLTLALSTPGDALALTFVTWATVVRRVKFRVILLDTEGKAMLRSEVTRLGLRDWEEIVFDLRGMPEAGGLKVEVSVLEGQGRLGIPLYGSASPRTCRLSAGASPVGHVPAGRLLRIVADGNASTSPVRR